MFSVGDRSDDVAMHIEEEVLSQSTQQRKRFKLPPKRIIHSFEELLHLDDDDVGTEIELHFHINLEGIVQVAKQTNFLNRLTSIEICPEFNDHLMTPRLVLEDGYISFPQLERLSIRNHIVERVNVSHATFPVLQTFKISHPLGVDISIFRINCPESLETITLEYLAVSDGLGLSMSLSPSHNRQLKHVRKYATTTYFYGIV